MTPPFVPSNRTIQPGLGNREHSDRAAGAQNPALHIQYVERCLHPVHLVYPSTTYRASLSRASRPLAKACHAAPAKFSGLDKQSAAILNSSGKVAYMSAANVVAVGPVTEQPPPSAEH
jgi:hypothetical protein